MNETILIIGATGVFGSRLAAHLADTAGFHLVLASRSRRRAEEFVARIRQRATAKASLTPFELDAPGGLAAALRDVRPKLVVDCSGPFQTQGYDAPRAAAAAGAHFVDLADARGYLSGFARELDELFSCRGLVALAGASSSPALSAATVAALTRGWRRVDDIDIAIMPGGQSEVGEAAVTAALGYCGRPVPIIESGQLDAAIGWGEARCIEAQALGRRTVSPAETADAELLAASYPTARRIRFWAGLGSVLEHRSLWLLAKLPLRFPPRQVARWGSRLTRVRSFTRLTGGKTGGMRVRVTGLDAGGDWAQAEWRLIARDNQGPQVPPSPAAAAVRAILGGAIAPGARPALALPLDLIEREFEGYAIETRRETRQAQACFVASAVGAGFGRLAHAVQGFHRADAPPCWQGVAEISGASTSLGGLVARLMGLPSAGRDVPVTVEVRRELGPGSDVPTETWTRRFAGRSFVSEIASPAAAETTERFGVLTFDFGLHVRGDRLHYPVTGWRIGRLRLPLALSPRSDAQEWQDAQARFNFDVRLSHPLLGELCHYRGWLLPG